MPPKWPDDVLAADVPNGHLQFCREILLLVFIFASPSNLRKSQMTKKLAILLTQVKSRFEQ
jgi:hypothetical protein